MLLSQKQSKKRKHVKDSFCDKLLTILLYPFRIFLFYFGFQFILRLIFKLSHKVKYDKNGKTLPKTPFLVLGNHVTDWDGLYLNTYLNKFIYFLVHDEVFKYKFRKIIAYNMCGQIKRGKIKSDIGPLKKLVDIKNSGKCIGIFPEGDISYIGKSMVIDKSISKLCKILNIPIVLTRIDGATYQRPRWSYEVRKTPVKLTITDVINIEDVKKLSGEELYTRIVDGIKYNDNEYQKINMNKMKAKNPAQSLQYTLFVCPECNSLNMCSSGDTFYCKDCGYKVKYNLYNQFEPIGENKSYFLNIEEWDNYQKGKLKQIAEKCRQDGSEILSYSGFSYNKVLSGDFFYKPINKGVLSLNNERLKFVSQDGDFIEEYPLGDIKDLYVQFKGAVEFTMGKYRYRFVSTNRQHYGYRYECFIDMLTNNQLGV